jgi:hypothetical protein
VIDFKKKLEEWIVAGRPDFLTKEGSELWNPVSDRLTIPINEGDCKMAIANASKLSQMWKKVTPIAASFSNVPDGDYIGDLKEMTLGNAKKGRLQVVFNWEVADGEQAGKTQKQFYGLSDDKGNPDETGMGYFKNVCEIIGLDLPEDLELWQETMDQFLVDHATVLYDIGAKANGAYTNIYINAVSDFTKGEEGAVEEEVATEEELEVVEVSEEEVVEEVEEEVQQVVTPVKRTVAVAKPVAKVAAKPVAAKPVAKVAVAPAKMSAQPAKKVATLVRR